MNNLLSSVATNILDAQVENRNLVQFAKDKGENIDTFRKMRLADLKTVDRVQKIIEDKYEIVLIEKKQTNIDGEAA